MKTLRLQTVLYEGATAVANRALLAAHLLAAQRSAAYLTSRTQAFEVSIGIACADQASQDAASDVVRSVTSMRPEVVRLPGNVGHGQGHNRLWEALGPTDFLVIQNPDGQLAFDTLTQLMRALADGANIALAEARQLPFDHPKAYTENGEVVWASGACFMVEGRVFSEVGGFDPLFFLHGDDVDLAVRIRLAGHGIRYVPSARFFHAKDIDCGSGRIAPSARESHYGRLGALLLARRYNPRALSHMTRELRHSRDPEAIAILEELRSLDDPLASALGAASGPSVLPIHGWDFGRHRY